MYLNKYCDLIYYVATTMVMCSGDLQPLLLQINLSTRSPYKWLHRSTASCTARRCRLHWRILRQHAARHFPSTGVSSFHSYRRQHNRGRGLLQRSVQLGEEDVQGAAWERAGELRDIHSCMHVCMRNVATATTVSVSVSRHSVMAAIINHVRISHWYTSPDCMAAASSPPPLSLSLSLSFSLSLSLSHSLTGPRPLAFGRLHNCRTCVFRQLVSNHVHALPHKQLITTDYILIFLRNVRISSSEYVV